MNKQFPVECMSHDLFSTKFALSGCCDPLARTDYKEPPVVVYAIENHPCYSRVRITNDGIVQTLNARMGTGGNNVPMVLMAIGSSNSNAAIATDGIIPTIMGIRGAHHDVPILCWAVDSHPMDSRIEIMDGAFPTVAAHVVKGGCDGPLVLIRRNE